MTVVLREKDTMNTYTYSDVKDYWIAYEVINIFFNDGSAGRFLAKEFVIGVVYE